ncbi:MAG TPA: polysaccharide lyase family 8 super-sandwich domain-containing protein, partial [Methylomirabilota bacterium]|nr:polysaccharide lyase family 8 super-sandwich domain-containing protein [Methylomirabilota bacterium]
MTIRNRWRVLMIVVALATTMPAHADEFDTLRLKWRDMLTQGTNASLANPLYSNWIVSVGATAQSYRNSLNTSPNRTNLWSTYPHLATNSSDITGTYSRLRAMALGYSVRGSSLETNASLRAAIISGLDWMHANFYNPTGAVYDNWFDFTIASPLALNDTVVLLYPNLSSAQVSNYMSAVDHFTPDPDLTAANKAWKALVVAVRSVIIKDANKIDIAHLAVSDVFRNVTAGDGFYADGSFIFHNYFPYNGGYGVELIENIALLMQLLSDTPWQVTDPAQTNVFRWVYDSFQPFLHRGALMQMVDGRYHTRRGDDHEYGHDLLATILRITQFAPPPDAAAYKSFAKAQIQSDKFRNFMIGQRPPFNIWANEVLTNAQIVPATEATGHRQFPSMDRVVHRPANWAFGLAMSSSRIAAYESTRGENLKGWFTGDGMTYLYNNELGYYAEHFWPTVDPYRLPGTTVDTVTRNNASGEGIRSQNNQTGGASILGLYGVAAMHMNAWNSTLSARKSWFMFDNEIVCLANSVSSIDGRGAETIVENRKLGLYGNNAFTVNGIAKPTGPGWSETMAGTSWAHLAGSVSGGDIGYYFPQTSTVQALRESRSGAMSELNSRYGSTNRFTRHYLTMYFDHGTNPPGATYSYVLLPGASASAVETYAGNPDVTVVENSSRVTAVKENKLGITAVNFWRDASNFVAGLSSDRKASVIFRSDGSVLDIGISDPTQTNEVGLNIELSMSASLVLSADAGISVLQTSPTIKLAVNSSNSLGATFRARFALLPLQTNTLLPVADAYVQNGEQSATNFGGTATLAVKAAGTNLTRETYLRFDLSSVPGSIMGATLRVVPLTINEPITNALALV